MLAPIHVAVLGFGRMGQLYAQTITRQVEGAVLYAVADPDLDQVAFSEYDVPHVLTDAHDAIALNDVHAVIVATPTSTHYDIVIAAAQAGKAVFCEKPLALSVADSRKMVAAVEEAGVPLQIGFMRRFDAGYRRAKELIASGQIGEPLLFKSVGRDPFCPPTEYADPVKSGGLIIDMGIHDFDLARWLMDSDVERVGAEGALLVCDNLRNVGDIDTAVVNLRFESGALGNVDLSRTAFYGYDIRTEVLGSDGSLRIGYDRQTPVLLLDREGAHHDVVPYLMERFGEAYRAQIHHFVECVRTGTPPAVGAADGVAAFMIALAATRAAETGRPVALADV